MFKEGKRNKGKTPKAAVWHCRHQHHMLVWCFWFQQNNPRAASSISQAKCRGFGQTLHNYDNTSPSSAELKGFRLFEFYWKKTELGNWSAAGVSQIPHCNHWPQLMTKGIWGRCLKALTQLLQNPPFYGDSSLSPKSCGYGNSLFYFV